MLSSCPNTLTCEDVVCTTVKYRCHNHILSFSEIHVSNLQVSVICDTDMYCKIKYGYINGITYSYIDGIIKNKSHIESILNHYSQIWPDSPNKNGLYTIHGDFSIR